MKMARSQWGYIWPVLCKISLLKCYFIVKLFFICLTCLVLSNIWTCRFAFLVFALYILQEANCQASYLSCLGAAVHFRKTRLEMWYSRHIVSNDNRFGDVASRYVPSEDLWLYPHRSRVWGVHDVWLDGGERSRLWGPGGWTQLQYTVMCSVHVNCAIQSPESSWVIFDTYYRQWDRWSCSLHLGVSRWRGKRVIYYMFSIKTVSQILMHPSSSFEC